MERIEINPKVCNGKPVIAGTRIPVSVILDQISEGMDWKDIVKGYPELSLEDVKASLKYASLLVEHENMELVEA